MNRKDNQFTNIGLINKSKIAPARLLYGLKRRKKTVIYSCNHYL